MDIETQGIIKTTYRSNTEVMDIIQNIICITIYSSRDLDKADKSWYIKDYNSSELMIKDCIEYLLSNYNNYKVYIHNLSGFDGIYLLNTISDYKTMLL